MKIKLDKGAKLPSRAHEADAGLDLFARETAIIYAKENHIFDTGVCVQLPKNSVGFLKSKSGLYMNHGITSEGVVDEGYTGSIRVNLVNHSDTPYVVNKGDKISQLVILPILKPELEIVDSLEETERGDKGFGSSGK
jgi:dUTP pyrophosphatase